MAFPRIFRLRYDFHRPGSYIFALILVFISRVVLRISQSWRLCQSTLSPVFVIPFQASGSAVVTRSVCPSRRRSTGSTEESSAFVGSVRCDLCRSHTHRTGVSGCTCPTDLHTYQRLDHHGRGCDGVGGHRWRASRLEVSLCVTCLTCTVTHDHTLESLTTMHTLGGQPSARCTMCTGTTFGLLRRSYIVESLALTIPRYEPNESRYVVENIYGLLGVTLHHSFSSLKKRCIYAKPTHRPLQIT